MSDDNTTLDCGHAPSEHDQYTTGYGEMEEKKFCWSCCAEHLDTQLVHCKRSKNSK